MSDRPSTVRICEEGPREGFQSEPPGILSSLKIELIEALAQTGLKDIACCSFVNPAQVPQMADAEAIASGIEKRTDVRYSGLWLNRAGFARAVETQLDLTGLVVASASESFALKNNRRDRAGMNAGQRELKVDYEISGVTRYAAYVFTAFGCNFEGDIQPSLVIRAIEDLLQIVADPEVVYLCDTIGSATPPMVERLIGTVRDRWPDLPIGLHLHDTRGLGIANAMTGLKLGVARFDTSIGGMGGCPFAGNRGAAGNLCTEDFAYLCEEMGIPTGLDFASLIEAAALAERIVGHTLPGKMRQAGRRPLTASI